MERAVYRALWALGLMHLRNRMLCRLGLYFQYQPGVCGWCGERHVDPKRHERQLLRSARRSMESR